jgi:hypothetical protein
MTVGDCPLSTPAGTAGDEHAWREITDDGLAWRFTDQDLARLSFDSSVEPAGAWRSGPAQPRVLIFTTTPLSLELELMADRVAGQIVPPGPGQIVVEAPDGILFQVEADDIGFFDFAGRPRGQVRLRCETPTGRLVTDWVCL